MKTRIVFTLLAAFFLLFLAGSAPAVADLGGSNVTFNSTAGAACYIPDRYQTLCFNAETMTTDGEDTQILWLRFPSTWSAYAYDLTVASASCTNGGTLDGIANWSYGGGLLDVYQQRTQNAPDDCTAVYCIYVGADAASTGDASVDWSWYSYDSVDHAPPHRPCSDTGWDDPPAGVCDATGIPAATVPICEHVALDIQPETLPPATVGVFYDQTLTASGPAEAVLGPYDWSWTAGWDLANQCDFYGDTGLLECWTNTLTTPGAYNFTVNVTGSGWSTGSRDYTLNVYAPLTFDPASLPVGKVGEAYEQVITVGGGTADYTITSGDLPAGLFSATDASAGTLTISGTPEAWGSFPIEITAVDLNGTTGAKTYTLWIAPVPAFTWTPDPIPQGGSATFTALPESVDYWWTGGRDPGDTCQDDPITFSGGNPKEIWFGAPGQYQVCLQYYVNEINDFVYPSETCSNWLDG